MLLDVEHAQGVGALPRQCADAGCVEIEIPSRTMQAALASILQGLQPLRDFEQTTYASLVHVQALQDQAAIIADMLGPAIAAAEGSGGAPSDAPSAQPPA